MSYKVGRALWPTTTKRQLHYYRPVVVVDDVVVTGTVADVVVDSMLITGPCVVTVYRYQQTNTMTQT